MQVPVSLLSGSPFLDFGIPGLLFFAFPAEHPRARYSVPQHYWNGVLTIPEVLIHGEIRRGRSAIRHLMVVRLNLGVRYNTAT